MYLLVEYVLKLLHCQCIYIPLSGVRDYIHVVDLAIGHVAAIKKLQEKCRHQVPIIANIVWPITYCLTLHYEKC